VLSFELSVVDEHRVVDPTPDRVQVAVRKYTTYLPQTYKDAAPDLVIQSLTGTANRVEVVILNQGSVPVSAPSFWVDLYVNPYPELLPIELNEDWYSITPGHQGADWWVWAGAGSAQLAPGGTLTLTVSSPQGSLTHPHLNQNQVHWPLLDGDQLYAQVDSYSSRNSTYGMVLETHELYQDRYNNVMGPASVSAGAH
jgi:hypothetical protein